MNKLNLGVLFPEDMLQITEVNQKEKATHIYLKSETKSCNCPKCGQLTEQYHGTYIGLFRTFLSLGKLSSCMLGHMSIIVKMTIVMLLHLQRVSMDFWIHIAE